ncbi:MAG: sigma-70 family RNA polymerase sigma factor [Lentisphaerota bacterium]
MDESNPLNRQPEQENAEFLAALNSGNEPAWQRFFETYDSVIRMVCSWARWHFTPQVREDICQSIKADMPRALRGFTGKSTLGEYIKRISTYQCIDEVRRQVKNRQLFVDVESLKAPDDDRSPLDQILKTGDAFDPVQAVIWTERGAALKGLLDKLDERCSKVIKPYHLQGFSYKELAKKLDIPLNNLCSRLARCHEKLRKMIKKDPVLMDYFEGAGD